MKWFALVLSLVFLIFGILQYNDSDAWVWMLVYFYMALLCFFGFIGRFNDVLIGVSAIAFLVAAIVLFPEKYDGLAGEMDSRPHVEQARESFGTGLCFLATLFIGILSVKKRLTRKKQRSANHE